MFSIAISMKVSKQDFNCYVYMFCWEHSAWDLEGQWTCWPLPRAGGGATALQTLTVTKYSPQMEPEETKTRSLPFLTGLQKCE